MISEELLERGLASAADAYEVMPDAVADMRDRLAPRLRRRLPRPHLSKGGWLATAAVAVVALLIVALAIGGKSSPSERAGTASGASNGTAGTIPAPAAAPGSATVNGGSVAAAGAPGASAGLGRLPEPPASPATPSLPSVDTAKVVKTGEMDLQVDKGQVEVILNRVTGIATFEQGYVSDSHTDNGDTPSGLVTLRVPAAKFEATVQQVQALKVKVTSQQLSGSDVTSKYVDLQARIHALQVTRSTYERLLARATTIGDILAVQSRITDVQTQIEQLQGQLRVLDDQSTYGTLTVTVDQKSAPAPFVHHRSGMSKAVHRSVDRFVNGIETIVGIIGPLLLVTILVALAIVVGRAGYRLLRRQLV